MCDYLTVLYEHKTRLETAVSQEKDITKKSKEGMQPLKPVSFRLLLLLHAVFTARQHAERAICYRKSVCLSVRPSVCLSVCLSVTRVDQSKTVERIIEILSPPDRPNILVFRLQRSLRKSDGFTPNRGAKYKGGSKN